MSNYKLIMFKKFVSSFTVKLCKELFFQLNLILNVYVRRLIVMGTVGNFLETKLYNQYSQLEQSQHA